MSRLVKMLRDKKKDTKYEEVMSTNPKKRKRMLNKRQRSTETELKESEVLPILRLFMDNKETIKRLDEQNKTYHPKLVEYTEKKGIEDEKGHRILRIGEFISKVQLSISEVVNADKVSSLVNRLLKRTVITKKEANRILKEEYTVVLDSYQYSKLKEQIADLGATAEREVKVDIDQLNSLVARGLVDMETYKNCFDVQQTRKTYYPTRG